MNIRSWDWMSLSVYAMLSFALVACAKDSTLALAERGPVGPTGVQGQPGGKGDQGNKGDKGDPGEVGPRGRRGDPGTPGLKGDQGPKGDKGDKGDNGTNGTKGDTGSKGDPGAKGDKGDKGDTGDQGKRGEKGAKGDVGPKGEKGNVGPRGERGATGNNGKDGKDAKVRASAEAHFYSLKNENELAAPIGHLKLSGRTQQVCSALYSRYAEDTRIQVHFLDSNAKIKKTDSNLSLTFYIPHDSKEGVVEIHRDGQIADVAGAPAQNSIRIGVGGQALQAQEVLAPARSALQFENTKQALLPIYGGIGGDHCTIEYQLPLEKVDGQMVMQLHASIDCSVLSSGNGKKKARAQAEVFCPLVNESTRVREPLPVAPAPRRHIVLPGIAPAPREVIPPMPPPKAPVFPPAPGMIPVIEEPGDPKVAPAPRPVTPAIPPVMD